MPDDPLFPETAAPVASQSGTTGSPSPTSPPGTGDSTAPHLRELAQAQAQTAAVLNQIHQQLQQMGRAPAQAPAPEPPADPNDLVSQLAADPEGVISRIAAKAARDGNTAQMQVLGTLINTQHQNLLDDAQFDLDRQFGEGAWAEVIKPKLDPFLTELRASNPTALADTQTMSRLVNMLKGEQMQSLVERQAKHTQALTAAQEAAVKRQAELISAQLPPSGLKRTSTDPDGRDIPGFDLMRAELKAQGIDIDPKEFAAFHGKVNTIDDFLKLKAAKPAAAAASR